MTGCIDTTKRDPDKWLTAFTAVDTDGGKPRVRLHLNADQRKDWTCREGCDLGLVITNSFRIA
jgi:hypothetical protein